MTETLFRSRYASMYMIAATGMTYAQRLAGIAGEGGCGIGRASVTGRPPFRTRPGSGRCSG